METRWIRQIHGTQQAYSFTGRRVLCTVCYIKCKKKWRFYIKALVKIKQEILFKKQIDFRELKNVGVASTPSQAGYYIFPDFRVCKPGLAKKGITTGEQMCNEIMKKKNVAVRKLMFLWGLNEFLYQNLMNNTSNFNMLCILTRHLFNSYFLALTFCIIQLNWRFVYALSNLTENMQWKVLHQITWLISILYMYKYLKRLYFSKSLYVYHFALYSFKRWRRTPMRIVSTLILLKKIHSLSKNSCLESWMLSADCVSLFKNINSYFFVRVWTKK